MTGEGCATVEHVSEFQWDRNVGCLMAFIHINTTAVTSRSACIDVFGQDTTVYRKITMLLVYKCCTF